MDPYRDQEGRPDRAATGNVPQIHAGREPVPEGEYNHETSAAAVSASFSHVDHGRHVAISLQLTHTSGQGLNNGDPCGHIQGFGGLIGRP